jgi:hypothetical protein
MYGKKGMSGLIERFADLPDARVAGRTDHGQSVAGIGAKRARPAGAASGFGLCRVGELAVNYHT